MTDSKDTKPAAAAKADDAALPTGFPEPAPEPEKTDRKAKAGHVILATRHPMGDLTVPPLEEGDETATITADGTEVNKATAARAHEAARLAGFTLHEL